MQDHLPRCRHAAKVRYSCVSEAESAIVRARLNSAQETNPSEDWGYYQCDHCGGYHITSHKKESESVFWGGRYSRGVNHK